MYCLTHLATTLNALPAKLGCFLFDLFIGVVMCPFGFPFDESTGRPFDWAAIAGTAITRMVSCLLPSSSDEKNTRNLRWALLKHSDKGFPSSKTSI